MQQLFQNISASCCVISSICIAFYAYYLEKRIDKSVLLYIAQCLIYAASLFGVSIALSNMLD